MPFFNIKTVTKNCFGQHFGDVVLHKIAVWMWAKRKQQRAVRCVACGTKDIFSVP